MQPKITRESLEYVITLLEERFVDKLPKSSVQSDQIHMMIGQQQVIRYLREVMETKYV